MSSFESSHVHTIYDLIAQDFSRTRHTRWPFVAEFLSSLPAGSVVLDAGCGNGKYLGCGSVLDWEEEGGGSWERGKKEGKGKEREGERRVLLPIGFDMSQGLLGIAKGKGHEVVRGDCFDLSCWRDGSFDHAISIATIHHFSSPFRRLESIKQLILAVSPPFSTSPSTSQRLSPSRILIVVWALEQDPTLNGIGSARRGKKGAVPVKVLGEDEGDEQGEGEGEGEGERQGEEEQDVFVPWSLQSPKVPKTPKVPKVKLKSTKEDNATAAVQLPPPPPPSSEPLTSHLSQLQLDSHSSSLPQTSSEPSPPAPPPPTFNRYYHLFRHLELSSLVRQAAKELGAEFVEGEGEIAGERGEGTKLEVRLREERWERENWVAEVEVRRR